jgi:uncharacterized protein
MIIKFTNYADGVHYFNFNEQASNLGLKEPYFNGVDLDVKMDKSHSQIVVNMDLSLNAKFFCDRCNDEFVAELKNHFMITYLFSKEQCESEDDNLYFLPPEADKIDLKPDVVDYAFLAIPMKKLCREECKGLCSGCGANLNRETCSCVVEEKANPIWSALLKKVQSNDDIK